MMDFQRAQTPKTAGSVNELREVLHKMKRHLALNLTTPGTDHPIETDGVTVPISAAMALILLSFLIVSLIILI